MFLLTYFLVCLSGWNFVIELKKRKGREKDEEKEKDENKKLK